MRADSTPRCTLGEGEAGADCHCGAAAAVAAAAAAAAAAGGCAGAVLKAASSALVEGGNSGPPRSSLGTVRPRRTTVETLVRSTVWKEAKTSDFPTHALVVVLYSHVVSSPWSYRRGAAEPCSARACSPRSDRMSFRTVSARPDRGVLACGAVVGSFARRAVRTGPARATAGG